jgi:hypothetical protein
VLAGELDRLLFPQPPDDRPLLVGVSAASKPSCSAERAI